MVFFEVKSVEDLNRAGIAKNFNFKSEILIDFNLTYVLMLHGRFHQNLEISIDF